MVKKKECYTKKKKDGGSYTTCVEGQKKPKRKTIIIRRKKKVVKKVAPKPKPTRAKKMSAGKSVLFTGGLMAKIGAYAISKTERARREKLAERRMKSYETRIYAFAEKMEVYNPSREVLKWGDGTWRRDQYGNNVSSQILGPLRENRPTPALTKKFLKKAKDMKKKYEEIRNNFKSMVGTRRPLPESLTYTRTSTYHLNTTIKLLERHMKYHNK